MINNTISLAEFKLRQHFENGENSTLSIEEVADLMDVVTFGLPVMNSGTRSIFFSFS
jgi:hypothetical protein